MLVDIGVGKQYKLSSTDTIDRHSLTPYEAPEQYTGETNTCSDIYGLGATFYTLLTGIVPFDALYRANRSIDPLVPVNQTVPAISPLVAEVIHQAMSLNSRDRFSSVQQFEQALKADPRLQALSKLKLPSIVHPGSRTATPTAALLHQTVLRSTPSPSSTVSTNLAGLYDGTISSIATSVTTKMSLPSIQHSQGNFSGDFAGLHVSGALRGMVDASRHIQFTVMDSAGHSFIFFEGAIQSDGNVAGSYCNLDQKRQCTGDYGVWSVAPA